MSATRAVYVMTSNEHVIFFAHSPDGLRAAQAFRRDKFCTYFRRRRIIGALQTEPVKLEHVYHLTGYATDCVQHDVYKGERAL